MSPSSNELMPLRAYPVYVDDLPSNVGKTVGVKKTVIWLDSLKREETRFFTEVVPEEGAEIFEIQKGVKKATGYIIGIKNEEGIKTLTIKKGKGGKRVRSGGES